MNDKLLEYYKETSAFTDLGYYKEFAKKLPDDIETLCLLQRMQIIHPVAFREENIRTKTDCFWGNMTEVEVTRLEYEEDIFPTAQSMLAELLRKDLEYSVKRKAKDKIHITCRGQAILLASILKAKGIPARARSGYAKYIKDDGIYYDHWITEYFEEKENRWKLVDADEHCPDHEMGFDLNDVPYDKFLFGAEAWLGLRSGKYKEKTILHSSNPITIGLKAAIRGLFYDFHSLMNDEIIFLHMPRYICEKDYKLNNEELKELDSLAELMLKPNENFEKLLHIWNTNTKFRIMYGVLNN